MATAEAQICNKALGRIGVKTWIDDLTTDQSEEAEACNVFYVDERDSLLKRFPWPFATKRAQLVLLANESRSGWAYCYALPSDCLQARYIWPNGLNQILYTPVQPSNLSGVWTNPRTPRYDQRVPYAIEKQTNSDDMMICCDFGSSVNGQPELVYTARITDVSKFSPLFTDALAWLLAQDIAMPLTMNVERYKLAKEEAHEALTLCEAEALKEQQEDVPPDSESIAVRL